MRSKRSFSAPARIVRHDVTNKDWFGIHYFTDPKKVPGFPALESERVDPVSDRFAFYANDYYTSLIGWDDPDDPIRRIIMPNVLELADGGRLDASHEHKYTVVPGLEHKYEYTVLLLVSNVCGGFCRFCFRKRLFMDDNREVVPDIRPGLDYIRAHPEVNNVLLTGGDPLMLSTARLRGIIEQLRGIEHVQIIRIGSKVPAFNPFRIMGDPSLENMLREFSGDRKKIYLMAHFNHPRELTDEAVIALNLLMEAGVTTVSQTPLLKGVNDDPDVLGELFNRLSYIGVPPYYVFQCRPTAGNAHFAVPIERGFEIFEQARMKCSGLAKRARFVISHASGKIEVVGLSNSHIFMRYHRAAEFHRKAQFMVFERNPCACWYDDYGKGDTLSAIKNPCRLYETA